MVFGLSELKNQLEETREERDFFQAKYQEQMKELTELRKALQASQREIMRLREEIIVTSPSKHRIEEEDDDNVDEEKKDEYDETESDNGDILTRLQSVASSITEASEIEDLDENAAIRESASKLLQWVDHRDSAQHQ